MREEDIQRIVDTYERYKDVEKYAYVATIEEIKENDYNLNIPRYVDTFEEELVDMEEVAGNISSIKEELAEVEVQMAKYLEKLGL